MILVNDSRSGIYTITNVVTGRIYVGSTNCAGTRWSGHKCALRNKRHANQKLQTDWTAYGEQTFEFDMVEEIVLNNYGRSQSDRDRLMEAERKWMGRYADRLYNIVLPMHRYRLLLTDEQRNYVDQHGGAEYIRRLIDRVQAEEAS